jgi:large subunit ribosomal protein L1
MAKHGKKYREAAKKVDAKTRYSIEEACLLVKETKTTRFNESVDIAVNLGVDPRQAEQNIRGAVVLPHGTGKTVRVAVFAKGSKAKEAEDAGADIVGAEDLAERVEKGFLEMDKVIASPDMMSVVGKLGKVLGPRGLMPNPKVGTVTVDVAKAVRDIKGGKIEFKVDKTGTVHAPVGRISFSVENLQENLKAFLYAIARARPATVKGQYLKKAVLSSTMGPGLKIDVNQVLSLTDRG